MGMLVIWLLLLLLLCKEIDSAHSGRFLWGDELCVPEGVVHFLGGMLGIFCC